MHQNYSLHVKICRLFFIAVSTQLKDFERTFIISSSVEAARIFMLDHRICVRNIYWAADPLPTQKLCYIETQWKEKVKICNKKKKSHPWIEFWIRTHWNPCRTNWIGFFVSSSTKKTFLRINCNWNYCVTVWDVSRSRFGNLNPIHVSSFPSLSRWLNINLLILTKWTPNPPLIILMFNILLITIKTIQTNQNSTPHTHTVEQYK